MSYNFSQRSIFFDDRKKRKTKGRSAVCWPLRFICAAQQQTSTSRSLNFIKDLFHCATKPFLWLKRVFPGNGEGGGFSWLFLGDGKSGISESCQRTRSITALQQSPLLLLWLGDTLLYVGLKENCKGRQNKETGEKETGLWGIKIEERERAKGSREQVHQSVLALQRLNGLMAVKCCDLGAKADLKEYQENTSCFRICTL